MSEDLETSPPPLSTPECPLAWKFESRDPEEYRSLTIETLKLEEGIRQFEANEITSEQLAEMVITSLLKIEFIGEGKHWSWNGAYANNHHILDGIDVYDCEASYTWDWKDIYSVAKATSAVGISPSNKKIIMYEYRFSCSG